MKKMLTLLTLMLAQVPLAVGQDSSTELYGDFRYAYAYARTGDATHWAGANNASRLGVRGDISGPSLTAFFDLQTGVNIDAERIGGAFTQRYYLAGIRGDFGTVTVGRQSTAYKMAGLRLDPFYDSSTLSAGGGVPGTGLLAGASFGLSNLTNGFADRTLAYTSPALYGFIANSAVYIDTESDHDYGIGLGYRGRGIETGLQYYDAGGDRNWAPSSGIDRGLRIHGGYRQVDSWSAGASYERVLADNESGQDFLYVAGTVNFTRRVLIAGAVGHVGDSGDVQTVTGTAFQFGAFYALFPSVRLHALFSHLDAGTEPNRSIMAVGLTTLFSITS